MQFSDTTNYQGLIQMCELRTKLGIGAISGSTSYLKEFVSYINQHNRSIWHNIFVAYGGWQYDDENYNNLPSATTSLVANTSTYSLPEGSLTVRGISIKDESGNWNEMIPLNEEEIRDVQSPDEFEKTPGDPKYFRLVGRTIKLYPTPNYSQSASLKVYIDRGSVAFSYDATTSSPGFASEYHDLLWMGAVIEWMIINTPTNSTLQEIKNNYNIKIQQMKEYYQIKFKQKFPPKISIYDSLKDNV